MQDIILYIDNIIRAESEIMYYKRNKESDTFDKKIERLTAEVSGYLNKMLERAVEKKDSLLEENIGRLLECQDISTTDISKNIYGIKEYILNNYDIDVCFYSEKNLKLINNRTSFLYEKIIDENIQNKNRQYEVGWNRICGISLSVELSENEKTNICSFGDPWREALLYAEKLNDDAQVCVIFGFGMGYHVQEISVMYPEKTIYIFENDIEQIRAAVYYRDVSDILLNENIHLIYCNDTVSYAGWIKKIIEKEENKKLECKMWMPSIKVIDDKNLRELLEQYSVSFFSMDYFRDKLVENFTKNTQLKDENVDAVKNDISGKDVILIAAGPSLDNETENLNKITKQRDRKNTVILCVGKIVRKVIEKGIIPDYIIMTDAKDKTRWQIRGVEKSGIPLIYISTASAKVAAEYVSKRYIAYQKGFEQAEEKAGQNGATLFETGGSVAAFAIDMALRFKCKRLICIGLDMGYTDERTHAGGIGGKISDRSKLKQVEAVGGGKAYTNKSLDIYRKWIEKRIAAEKDIELINASHGARIHGMREVDLKDIDDYK